MFGLDLVASLGGLIFPPVFDFVKKKFLKPKQDTPEATLSTLATTKPEVMGDFLNGTVALKEANIKFFNRVVGVAVVALICTGMQWLELDPGTRAFFEMNVSSWFGSRLTASGD